MADQSEVARKVVNEMVNMDALAAYLQDELAGRGEVSTTGDDSLLLEPFGDGPVLTLSDDGEGSLVLLVNEARIGVDATHTVDPCQLAAAPLGVIDGGLVELPRRGEPSGYALALRGGGALTSFDEHNDRTMVRVGGWA